MRVVTGQFRGTKLFSPKSSFIRPTTDKVKEAVFNILSLDLAGKTFLDLFGGSGGIGIEALSRGAQVTLVDSSRESFYLIKENLKKCRADATVIYGDSFLQLKKFAAEQTTFDYIYIDPPYATNYDVRVLAALESFDILKQNGTIIVEYTGAKTLLNRVSRFIMKDERRYGTVKLALIGYQEETP